jgi:acyl dehydratase
MPNALESMIGQPLGCSDWLKIDQDRINAFADITDDHQFIHVDKERAKKETPFGATIAHGMLTFSLLVPLMMPFLEKYSDGRTTLNYGCNTLRFINPVLCDAEIRLVTTIKSVDTKGDGSTLVTIDGVMEIKGQDKPAFVAEILCLLLGM